MVEKKPEVVVEKKEKGVLYGRVDHGDKWKWYKSDYGNTNGKYVGEIERGVPNGQGTLTSSYGGKYVGSWKRGQKWNGTEYNKYGNIFRKYVNGGKIKP